MSRLGFALFTAAALSSGCVGAARAADMPTKAPPYEAAVSAPGWTGFYLGGNLGGAWMTQDAAWNPLPSPAAFLAFPVTGRLDPSHFVGGVHGGYNWQLAPTWVIGIEGDYSWTGASASTQGVWNFFPSGGPVPGSLSTSRSAATSPSAPELCKANSEFESPKSHPRQPATGIFWDVWRPPRLPPIRFAPRLAVTLPSSPEAASWV